MEVRMINTLSRKFSRLLFVLTLLFGSQLFVLAQDLTSPGDIQPGSAIFVFKKPKNLFSASYSKKAQTQDGSKGKAQPSNKPSPQVSKTKKTSGAKPVPDEPIAPEDWINEGAQNAIDERQISDSEPFLSLKSGFLNSRYQFCASPQFPNAARKTKQKLVQSKVLVTVAKYGGVLDAKVLEGDPSFRSAVYQTLESMRFRQSYFMGQLVRIEGLLNFTQNPANEIVCNTASQDLEIPSVIDGGELDGLAKSCEVPDFPSEAKSAGLKTVAAKIRVIVGEDGKVIDAKFIDGHPSFGQAAVQSALKTVFPKSMITEKYVKVHGIMNFSQTPDNQTKCVGLPK
jgi:hypothetical protein